MTTGDTNLNEIMNRIDTEWARLQESFDGLSDDDLLEPGVSGDWSVRDILAHVAAWDALVTEVLPGILETGRHIEDDQANKDLDAYNARKTEEMRHLSVDEVRSELEANHQRLITYLGTVDPSAFAANAAFRERLAADTWDHYPEHAAAIRDWRERRS